MVEYALLHTGGTFPARARDYPIQSNSSVARADQQAGQGAITLAYSLETGFQNCASSHDKLRLETEWIYGGFNKDDNAFIVSRLKWSS